MAPKKRARKPKNASVSSSSAFQTAEMLATSSPTSSSAFDPNNLQIIDYYNKCQETIRKEATLAKDIIKYHIGLCKVKVGPSGHDTIFEFWNDQKVGMTTLGTGIAAPSETRRIPESRKEVELAKSKPEVNVVDSQGFKIPTQKKGRKKTAVQDQNVGNVFQTPKLRGYRNIAQVTPGPNINTPITVMRRPTPGETAISLDGSPLLISSDVVASIPNVNVPLDENKIISIFPREGFDPAEMPALDAETRENLEMLEKYLHEILHTKI